MINIKNNLKKISLFNHLAEDDLEKLASFCSTTKYAKESILYYESETTNKLLFLVKGMIKVYKVDKFDNEIFLYYIYENSMISELSNLESDTIHCFSNAEFIEEGEILSIDFQKFKEQFLAKDELTLKFIMEIINKNRQLQCIVNRELVFDATSKVAFMLFNDLEMFNKIKRTEVSFMLHIQPETLSRVLKRLQRNQIISIDKGIIEVLNKEQLQSIFLGIG